MFEIVLAVTHQPLQMETVADKLFILSEFGNKAIRVLHSHVKLYNFVSNPVEQDVLFGDSNIPIKTGLSLLLDPTYQPLYKALLKKFPDIRDTPKNVVVLMEQNQKVFVDSLQGIYNSLSVFLQFQNDTLEVLKLAEGIKYLNYDVNPDLCMMVLDVVKQIVFGHQLINTLGDRRKLIVSVYAKAYFLENGINEPLFRVLSDLCINVDKIQQYVMELFQPFTSIIHLAINSFQVDFPGGAVITADSLRKTKSLRFVGGLNEPVYDDKTFKMLYHLDRNTENIIAAAMACPNDLITVDKQVHVLSYAITITDKLYTCGDVFVDIGSEFDQIQKISSKSSKTNKQVGESLANVAARVSLHIDRRECISKLLSECLLAGKADAGFLATKCPSIFSLLSLGYHELVYYLRQFERQSARRAKTALAPTFSWVTIHLLSHIMQVKDLILKNAPLVQNYFIELLKKTYANELNEYLNVIQTSSEPDLVKSMWNDIHLNLCNLNPTNPAGNKKGLAVVRATWLRLQVYFATQSPPSAQSTQAMLAKLMNEIVFRSKFIDLFQQELENITPLYNLFYYRYALMDHISQFTTMPQFDTTSHEIMGAVHVAKYFNQLVIFESQVTKQDQRILGFVKLYVEVGTHLLIDTASFIMHNLNLEFARLYLLSHSFGQQSLLTEDEKKVMVYPGFESMLNHKNISLLKWAIQQDMLHGLVGSMSNPFMINNSLFTPMVDVVKSLNKVIVGVLKTSILDNNTTNNGSMSPYNIYAKDSPIMQQSAYMIKRPTLFLVGLLGYFDNCKRIVNYTNYDYIYYDVSKLLRDQSNLQTANTELQASSPIKSKNNKKNVANNMEQLLVTQVINWLMDVIGSKTVAVNFGISPVRKSLESYGQDPFPLHHFICYKEFYAIAECIGPNARILLREKIYSVAKSIYEEIFAAIKPVYEMIDSEKSDKNDAKIMECIGRTRSAPEFNDWMLQFGTLGMLFELEDLTSEAFRDSMQMNSSYLQTVVEHGDLALHAKLGELVEMITSSGIKSKQIKSKFQMANTLDLKKFTTTLAIFMVSLALDETIMVFVYLFSIILFTAHLQEIYKVFHTQLPFY